MNFCWNIINDQYQKILGIFFWTSVRGLQMTCLIMMKVHGLFLLMTLWNLHALKLLGQKVQQCSTKGTF